MAVHLVIPARYDSHRFPGKALADLWGHPMIWHVVQQAKKLPLVDSVWVATDDQRIAEAVHHEAQIKLTSSEHPCGSDRVAEVALVEGWSDHDVVINLQGDEPLIPVTMLEQLITFMQTQTIPQMASVMTPLSNQQEWLSPHVVKVMVSEKMTATSFFREPLKSVHHLKQAYRHVGVYAWQVQTLLEIAHQVPHPLEKQLNLEQLRAMEMGIPIQMSLWKGLHPPGVDTPRDLEIVRQMLQKKDYSSDQG